MTDKKPPIYIMPDDEFVNMKLGEESRHKESFLDSLMEASKNNTKFTTTGMKKKDSNSKKPSLTSTSDDLLMSSLSIPDRIDDDVMISDDVWDRMITQFDELSPIDDITSQERFGYRKNREGEDEYQELFKKEKSMLNDVLSDLQKRSKVLSKKIDAMTGKGAYGVTKNFVDLIEASTALENTKLSVIKEMVNVKKTATDLRLKDKRMNPESEDDNIDSVADAFYKQIMGGNNKDFLQNTLSPYSGMQMAQGVIVGGRSDSSQLTSNGSSDDDDEFRDDIGFNISQPISTQYSIEDDPTLNVDKYGYIANETRNVEVCVYRYDDDTLKFVALDENGEIVNNYQLPESYLLNDMSIKPMARYAYDRFQRKYRIVDASAPGVDLDDLDDDYYDSVTNDDKYNID